MSYPARLLIIQSVLMCGCECIYGDIYMALVCREEGVRGEGLPARAVVLAVRVRRLLPPRHRRVPLRGRAHRVLRHDRRRARRRVLLRGELRGAARVAHARARRAQPARAARPQQGARLSLLFYSLSLFLLSTALTLSHHSR